MRQPPRPIVCLLIAVMLGTFAATAFAADAPAPAACCENCGPECDCDPCVCDNANTLVAESGLPDVFDDDKPAAKASSRQPAPMLDVFGVESRLAALESKVEQLDRTKVTADEARQIAKEEIAKVTIALQGSSGQIRTQQVSVNSNYQGAFDVRPGETLLGYSDPMTGQYVDLTSQRQYQRPHQAYREPVHYYDSPNAQFAVGTPVQSRNTRQGWFSARQPLQQWFGSGGGNCAGGSCGI